MKRKNRLSKAFSRSYRLFMENRIPISVLRNSMETLNDAAFYRNFCDPKSDISADIHMIILKRLEKVINTLLSEMEKCNKVDRKQMLRTVLITFLGMYSCFTNENTKEKTNQIILYFSHETVATSRNETLNEEILEMLNLFISSRDLVKDKEKLFKRVLFKFVCLYVALAVSDKEGRIKLDEIGKILSKNWHKSTPEAVTLNILKRREKNSKLPLDECELLGEYSFWPLNEKKRSCEPTAPFF